MFSLIRGLRAQIKAIRNDKRGVTALEYGLIAAAIVGTVSVGFGSLTTALSTQFTNIGSSL